MLNLNDFLNIQKQISDLDNKNNQKKISYSVDYIDGVFCFSIINCATFLLFGILYFALFQYKEELHLFSLQYAFISQHAFISLISVLFLFTLNDQDYIIKHFSKPFSILYAFPAQIIAILLCSVGFFPLSAIFSVLFAHFLMIPVGFIVSFSIVFSACLFLFSNFYCFRLYNSLKKDNSNKKCYKNKIEELNKKFVNSVNNFDDYLLFSEYANIHRLKNKESIISKMESNLINKTHFKNFNEYKMQKLLERSKTNEMLIINE